MGSRPHRFAVQIPAAPEAAEGSGPPVPAGRLRAIDAARGAAALAVLLLHVTATPAPLEGSPAPSWLRIIQIPFWFGFAGVPLFFVISGFCIHLRCARSLAAGSGPEIDFADFWKRRIRRLYPPYVVALLLSTAVSLGAGSVDWSGRTGASAALHLVMAHNLTGHGAYDFNPAFWTLAIEEQLYLAYFLLLPLRRRLGWGLSLAVCLAVRAAWQVGAILLYRELRIQTYVVEAAASQWFLWALGAVSVEAACGLIRLHPRWSDARLAFLLLAGGAAGSWFGDLRPAPYHRLAEVLHFVTYPLWGLGFFVLLNGLVARELSGAAISGSWFKRLAQVGVFSYSLYLTHCTLVFTGAEWLWRAFHVDEVTLFWLRVGLGLPLALLLARGFYHWFERPFLNRPGPARPPEARPAPTG